MRSTLQGARRGKREEAVVVFAVDEKQSDRSSAGTAPSCKALFTRPKHAAAIGPSPGAFPALFGKGARDNSSSTSTLVGQEPICWSVTVAPVFSFLNSGVYLLISDHGEAEDISPVRQAKTLPSEDLGGPRVQSSECQSVDQHCSSAQRSPKNQKHPAQPSPLPRSPYQLEKLR
ncbi:hypothetical protein CKAH01_07730 [Colletotrichum kahawae]|uniref:Uncharacterized protein n=1 Tax=Colletotrichum kahawae TaxID=34407 RepID=A0AAD9Y367_COLKA|nr:hypothetical protein CKAH01_07730 [Colletotrichum kahawae]